MYKFYLLFLLYFKGGGEAGGFIQFLSIFVYFRRELKASFRKHKFVNIKPNQLRFLRNRQKCHSVSTMSKRTIYDKFSF